MDLNTALEKAKRKYKIKQERPYDKYSLKHERNHQKKSCATTHNDINKNKTDKKQTIGSQPVVNGGLSGSHDKKEEGLSGSQPVVKMNTGKNKKMNEGLSGSQYGSQDFKNEGLSGSQPVVIRESNTGFFDLSKLEFELLSLICKKADLLGDKNYVRITTDEVVKNLQCHITTVKTLITRLKKKTNLSVVSSKACRGGFRIFSIPYRIWQEWQNIKPVVNEELSGSCPVVKPVVNGESNGESTTSSSSSIYNLNTTTTEEDLWGHINIQELEDIGFTETHVKQIKASENSTPELLKKSIQYFSYMREKKTQEIRNPLAFFMKAMRNEGAIPKPIGYKSKLERNLERLQKEKEDEETRVRNFVNENFEMLLATPKVREEKENLMKNNIPGFYTEDSIAFKETMKSIMIDKIKKGELSLGGLANG